MKYVDAEKLKSDLESLYDNMLNRTKIDKDNSDYWAGKADAYRNVIDTITSIQQEQEQYVIGGQVFGATDIEQLYEGKVYIISNLVQDTEFELSVRDKVKMLIIKD